MSDSDTPARSVSSRSSATAVTKPPGAQIRRRAATSQVARPNSSRAAGAGGSSNTMLKLYTDDSPGLRVDPFIVWSFHSLHRIYILPPYLRQNYPRLLQVKG
ncbi:hypothetical protein BGY98DRAFT_459697 [Russula aff. rugulosa BPL654]|nr:hypothetical protein BGY98DRAFT_459697 [Russula aff. rugulosa BPL654]